MADYKIFNILGYCLKKGKDIAIPIKYAPLPHNRWEKFASIANCKPSCEHCPIYEEAPKIKSDND